MQPNGAAATASAALHTGGGAITNVPTQQICPDDVDEHLTIGTIDPVAYAIAVNALTHTAPADVSEIPSSVCSQTYMPGVNPADVSMYVNLLEAAPGLGSVAAGALAGVTSGAPVLYSSPPLACYVYATCTGADAPTLLLRVVLKHRTGFHALHARVMVLEGTQQVPVAGVKVRLAGHSAVTGPGGRVTLHVRLLARDHYRITATRQGCNTAAAELTGA